VRANPGAAYTGVAELAFACALGVPMPVTAAAHAAFARAAKLAK
jgi:hypothetical protein